MRPALPPRHIHCNDLLIYFLQALERLIDTITRDLGKEVADNLYEKVTLSLSS